MGLVMDIVTEEQDNDVHLKNQTTIDLRELEPTESELNRRAARFCNFAGVDFEWALEDRLVYSVYNVDDELTYLFPIFYVDIRKGEVLRDADDSMAFFKHIKAALKANLFMLKQEE